MICFRLFPFVCLTFAGNFVSRSLEQVIRLFIELVCVIVVHAVWFPLYWLFHFSHHRPPLSRSPSAFSANSNAIFFPVVFVLCACSVRKRFRRYNLHWVAVCVCVSADCGMWVCVWCHDSFTFPTPFCVTLCYWFLTQNKRKTSSATFSVALCLISGEVVRHDGMKTDVCGFQCTQPYTGSTSAVVAMPSNGCGYGVCGVILFTLFYCVVMSLFI